MMRKITKQIVDNLIFFPPPRRNSCYGHVPVPRLVSSGLFQITSIYFCSLIYLKKNTVEHYLIDLARAANWRAPRAAKVLGTPLRSEMDSNLILIMKCS